MIADPCAGCFLVLVNAAAEDKDTCTYHNFDMLESVLSNNVRQLSQSLRQPALHERYALQAAGYTCIEVRSLPAGTSRCASSGLLLPRHLASSSTCCTQAQSKEPKPRPSVSSLLRRMSSIISSPCSSLPVQQGLMYRESARSANTFHACRHIYLSCSLLVKRGARSNICHLDSQAL